MCDLGLCPFSGLVCDLLLRGVRGLSPKCALPEEYLDHNCQKSISLFQMSISMQTPKNPITQIYMDLSYIDPQARVLNYCFK